jgi:uncharacterized metal-binding protein
MNRLLLIPCSHVNREGEICLQACHFLKKKYPRKFLILTPPTIGVSPIVIFSFGIDPDNFIAINGCSRRCVDKIIELNCHRRPSHSIVLFGEQPSNSRSALTVTNSDVIECSKKLESFIAPLISN